MILASFFSEDNVLSDEIKICYIFRISKYQNSSVPLYLGHPVYIDYILQVKAPYRLSQLFLMSSVLVLQTSIHQWTWCSHCKRQRALWGNSVGTERSCSTPVCWVAFCGNGKKRNIMNFRMRTIAHNHRAFSHYIKFLNSNIGYNFNQFNSVQFNFIDPRRKFVVITCNRQQIIEDWQKQKTLIV